MQWVLDEKLAIIMRGTNQQGGKDLVNAEEPSRSGQRISGVMEKISFLLEDSQN